MTVEVDTSQWQKIRPAELRTGDEILAVRHSSMTHIASGQLQGIVTISGHEASIGGWAVESDGLRDLVLYKRRPPFVLPENRVGAVVKARSKSDGSNVLFVYVDVDDPDQPWAMAGGSMEWFSGDEIMNAYTHHELVNEGGSVDGQQ